MWSVHESVAEKFIRDAERAIEMEPEVDSKQIFALAEKGMFADIIKGIEEGRIDSSVIPMLLEAIPEEMAVELIKNVVIEWFR